VWLALAFSLMGLTSGQQTTTLVGTGSTLPATLFSRWAAEYNKRSPQFQMRYLPVGTSEGIKQVSLGVGGFGVGEAPLTGKEREEQGLVELPLLLVGIVPIYNLEHVGSDLRLSGEVLAEIFLGDIRTWNAPSIARLNPDRMLPNLPIRVVYRASGRGSNYIFTSFLSKTNARFRAQIGTTTSPRWPVGKAAQFNSEMIDTVKKEPGSIGYVELQYAVKANVQQATLLNAAGHFVKASRETLVAACAMVEQGQWNNFSASLTNAPGPDSFPITSFSWLYVRKENVRRTDTVADFLSWIFTEGQQYLPAEGYVELPGPLLAAVRSRVETLR
jgi:phosphate transport system substrate-binding protein